MTMKTDEFQGIRFTGAQAAIVRNIRCPHCGKIGAFHGLENVHDAGWMTVRKSPSGQPTQKDGYCGGIRICPNPECRSLVLISFQKSEASNLVFPFEVIEFDASGIPAEIVKSFKEALICHSTGCYRACALMVRRTLEEICEDQNVKAPNLKQRIAALGSKIIIPKELVDAADELRLLGNDAAHIESQDYAEIGTKEVEISILFVKEILKATYQYASLLSQLRALKKS
jgi:uncharacterized protein DUF4145